MDIKESFIRYAIHRSILNYLFSWQCLSITNGPVNLNNFWQFHFLLLAFKEHNITHISLFCMLVKVFCHNLVVLKVMNILCKQISHSRSSPTKKFCFWLKNLADGKKENQNFPPINSLIIPFKQTFFIKSVNTLF